MLTVLTFIIFCLSTILIYQSWTICQKKYELIWLNPMLFSIIIIIPILLYLDISFVEYYENTQVFSYLLEPAIVVLGLPLYTQLKTIKHELVPILTILISSIVVVIFASILLSKLAVENSEVAVSLALKSITTPIGLALTTQLNGIESITAIAIIIAGLTGGLYGIKWLSFLKINCPKAQGLAIGCGSHALGTVCVSNISYQHTAYSALALILSAIITAILSPFLIPLLINFLF